MEKKIFQNFFKLKNKQIKNLLFHKSNKKIFFHSKVNPLNSWKNKLNLSQNNLINSNLMLSLLKKG